MNKHLIWATALVTIFIIISGTLIWINHNSWTLRFEMDENTKEAIESIEFDEINNGEERCFKQEIITEKLFDAKENTISIGNDSFYISGVTGYIYEMNASDNILNIDDCFIIGDENVTWEYCGERYSNGKLNAMEKIRNEN